MAVTTRRARTQDLTVDPAPILFFVGVILSSVGLGMLVPAGLDLADGNPDYKVFLSCSAIAVFAGACMVASTYSAKTKMNPREVMLAVPMTWVFVTLFGGLPFMLSQFDLSFTDAMFETMSGLTATGSTVIIGLDHAPKGLLWWRFQLVWFGGFGVVTIALLVLPFLRIGGMQMFSLDLSAQAGRFLPRITAVIARIGLIYLLITALAAITFGALGMDAFDAIGHAMAAVATGGFSSHDANIGYFQSAAIEYAASFFMLFSALPFVLHLQVLRGRPGALWQDAQVRLFIAIVFFSILSVMVWLASIKGLSLTEALRGATFNVVSLVTCTGFTSQDFSQWGAFPLVILLSLMLAGGCTGSTAGGIKMFRIRVLLEHLRVRLHLQVFPHASQVLLYNREPVPVEVRAGVTNYFFIYIATFFLLALALSATGLSFEESLSASATALGGVGPGFGPVIGPCCTFQPISDAAKWLLTLGMLAGRLEILIVILPFTRTFWRD